MNVLNKTEMNEKTTPTKGVLHAHDAPSSYSLKRYYPSAELAPFVEHYWIVRWDLPDGETYDNEILPYPNVNAAITEDTDMISGVVTGTYSHKLSGKGAVAGIKFLPGGFYPFYKKPIERLTNQTLPLKTVFQPVRIKAIRARLFEPDAIIVDLVEKMLLARNPQPDGSIALIGDIIENVKHDSSIRTVQPLLETYGVSERTLQYAFKNYVGIGLKWIILRSRLQDVADAIDNGRSDWPAIAQEFGFADQSHVIRDFKKVLGETPAQYASRVHEKS
jgi:AraC-like DNA-binding protein